MTTKLDYQDEFHEDYKSLIETRELFRAGKIDRLSALALTKMHMEHTRKFNAWHSAKRYSNNRPETKKNPAKKKFIKGNGLRGIIKSKRK